MPTPIRLPGTTPAGGPEPTLEWVRPGGGILGAVAARLGSDPSAEELIIAVMRALRTRLPADSWEAIAEELAFSTRAILRNDVAGGGMTHGEDLVDEVARAMLHPRAQAALEVRAVFASMKRALPRGLAEAIPGELPVDVREIWLAAR